MPHAGLDLGFHSHPKVLKAGNAAAGVYAKAVSYCADQLTDGLVSKEWAQMHGKAECKKLVDLGLFVATEDGYRIPDFLEHNLSRERVEQERENKRKAGKAGAASRWEKAGAIAAAMADEQQEPWQNDGPSPLPIPSPTPEPGSEGFQETGKTSDVGEAEPIDGKRAVVDKLLGEIHDRTPITDRYVLGLANRAPEAAVIHALEALQRRRRRKPALVSEGKYVTSVLTDYLKGGNTRREANQPHQPKRINGQVREALAVLQPTGTDNDSPF